jgi:hypothetical protein
MSWTIEITKDQAKHLNSLDKAIKKAELKGILMFCAASDQGKSTKLRCYPGYWGSCLRIGASTGTGERCAWVHGDDIEVQLPGENIAFDLGDPSAPAEHSGSSVATAVAAGLAGLIKYLHRVHGPNTDTFKRKDGIHLAFRYLGDPFPYPDRLKFLEKKNWKKGIDRTHIRKGLEDLVQKIKVSLAADTQSPARY